MSEQRGFELIDSASRVREVIKKVAVQEIGKAVTTRSVGRVMTVDLPRLRANVWFPNEEQPIEVRLLSSVIPGDWQHRTDRGAYDSTSGYGSMAVVERINNTLYITAVLTGGQFSFDSQTMNHSIVAQRATPTSAAETTSITAIVDQPFETFINCRVTDTTVGRNQALEFGPFTQYQAGQPGIGFVEITVSLLPNRGQRYYRFVVNPAQEFDHPGSTGILDSWFRILPEQVISDIDNTNGNSSNFDFDISYKRTAYGNTADYSGYPEIWFRIVKRSAWSGGGLDAFVTIRATNIQKARSLGGRELFMQEKRLSPAEIHGYLGFHNSKHLFRDTDDYAVFDNFGRVTAPDTGWQNSDSGQSWSGTTSMYADGFSGVMSMTAANQLRETRIEDNVTDYDCTWVCWVEQVATGAEFQVQGLFRYLNSNNKIALKVIFDVGGVVKLSFVELIAGSGTILGPDVTAGFTYSANTKIRCRMKMVGFAAYGKIWLDGDREPEAWMKEVAITGSNLGGPGYGYGFQTTTGAANTNTRPSLIHFSEVKLFLKTPTYDNTGVLWHTGPFRNGPLRAANDIQKTWTHSPYGIRWKNGRIKWGRIFLGGIGSHRDALVYGRTTLPMPESGTAIPVTPSGTTVTVNIDGIPLTQDQSLWVAIPPGQDYKDVDKFLFIVNGASGRDYQLPEWAVMIAARGPSGNAVFEANAHPELRLGNGTELDPWIPITFNTNWTNFGGGAQNAECRMENGNVVRLRGLVKNTLASPGGPQSVTGVIGSMPFNYAPSAQQVYHTIAFGTSTGAARININASGEIETPLQMNGGGAIWISLDGITFVADI